MKLRQLMCAIAGMALVLATVACNLPAGPDTSPAPSPSPSPSASTTPVQMLKAIPDIGQMLPKSLQAGASSSSVSASMRALGDVTELTPALLPGVTANGYQQVKQQISTSMLKTVLDILKQAIDGKDVPLDSDYRLGTITMPAYTNMGSMDAGVIRISKPSTDVTEIKWYIKVNQPTGAGSTIVVPFYIYIKITGTDTATMKVALLFKGEVSYNGQTKTQATACSYDATTKEMVSVNLPSSASGDYGSYQSITTANGYTTYLNQFSSSTYSGTQVAYANDQMGGVVNAYSGSYNGSSYDGVNTEFYNADGNLVMTQWGKSGADSFSWITSQFSDTNATNVKSILTGVSAKPTVVYRKMDYSYTWYGNTQTQTNTRKIYWSVDKTTWVEDTAKAKTWTDNNWPQDGWTNPVWMAGSIPASGDSLYYYKEGDWTAGTGTYDQASNTSTWSYSSLDSYQVGFTIPSKTSYLGKDYYLQNRFMLKFLSLDPALAADFKIKMKEGGTYYCWDDGNQWNSASTKPSNWDSIPDYQKGTWTNFEYWLENTAYKDKDGNATNVATSYDQDKGDLRLQNLREDTFYLWQDGVGKEMKAQVLDTTEAAPVGFSFSQTALVDTVKAAIENYYQTKVPAFDSASLQAKADAIGTMPDTASFPTY